MTTRALFFGILLLGLLVPQQSAAQGGGPLVEDFEGFSLGLSAYLNDAGPSGFFESDLVKLNNSYNQVYDFWSGWALSSMVDTETPGFTNQYSSITGSGAEETNTYAVTFAGSGSTIVFPNKGSQPQSMMITNSTYAYYSMLEGDAFAKRFGGEDGTDPDFLRVKARGFLNGFETEDSIVVYLADFRFENSEDDYILSEWMEVDLSVFQEIDSIQFSMESSDVGAFGINTPLYFCVDQIKIDLTTLLTPERSLGKVTLFPNPASEQVTIRGFKTDEDVLQVYTSSGKLMKSQQVRFLQATVQLLDFAPGTYFIRSKDGIKGSFVRK